METNDKKKLITNQSAHNYLICKDNDNENEKPKSVLSCFAKIPRKRDTNIGTE